MILYKGRRYELSTSTHTESVIDIDALIEGKDTEIARLKSVMREASRFIGFMTNQKTARAAELLRIEINLPENQENGGEA